MENEMDDINIEHQYLREYYEFRLKKTHFVQKPRRIAYKIAHNLFDRRGFRQEWDNCDMDVQNEILETITGIISNDNWEDGNKD